MRKRRAIPEIPKHHFKVVTMLLTAGTSPSLMLCQCGESENGLQIQRGLQYGSQGLKAYFSSPTSRHD